MCTHPCKHALARLQDNEEYIVILGMCTCHVMCVRASLGLRIVYVYLYTNKLKPRNFIFLSMYVGMGIYLYFTLNLNLSPSHLLVFNTIIIRNGVNTRVLLHH